MHIKINYENTVIFENLPKINMSFDNYLNYFNNIISTTFDIPTYKFNSSFNYSLKSIILKLDSPISKNNIINNSKIKLNIIHDFKNIFTRISLPNSEIIRKKILYHAIKSNMLDSNIKLVVNKFTMKYELHKLVDNKIEWHSKIPEVDYEKWSTSFITYQKSFSSNDNST